jgi:hypothetical protein
LTIFDTLDIATQQLGDALQQVKLLTNPQAAALAPVSAPPR